MNFGREPVNAHLQQRRLLCQGLLSLIPMSFGAASTAGAGATSTTARKLLHKEIPGTGEYLPCVGMGSWITFDVPRDQGVWDQRASVLQHFFDLGGGMIDSSPMYGYAEQVIGYCLAQINYQDKLFAASKIWTPAGFMRGTQMSNTESYWGVKPMDLMFVHNLLAVKKHLPVLREWKASGRIRYLGVSTSHGRRHQELEALMRSDQLDFIQLTLNIERPEVEERLLPLAADLGIAVVANRPFQRGALFDKYDPRPLPALATELGCENWAQFFLLYIISHPAVTCAIPATSRVDHMIENMRVLRLSMPDEKTRSLMRAALV